MRVAAIVKRILDRTFRYTPSHETDIRKTIARELRRLAEIKRKEEEAQAEAALKVKPIIKVKS